MIPLPSGDLWQFAGAIILLVGLILIVAWVTAGSTKEERPDDRDRKPPAP